MAEYPDKRAKLDETAGNESAAAYGLYPFDEQVRQVFENSSVQLPSRVGGQFGLLNKSAAPEPRLFQTIFDLNLANVVFDSAKVSEDAPPVTKISQLARADAVVVVSGKENLAELTEILRRGYFPGMRHLQLALPKKPDTNSIEEFFEALASRSAQLESLSIDSSDDIFNDVSYPDASALQYTFNWTGLRALSTTESTLTLLGVSLENDPVVVFPALTYLKLTFNPETSLFDNSDTSEKFCKRFAAIAPAVTHFCLTMELADAYIDAGEDIESLRRRVFRVAEYRLPKPIRSFVLLVDSYSTVPDPHNWHVAIIETFLQKLLTSGIAENVQTLSLQARFGPDGDLPVLNRSQWPRLRKLRVSTGSKFARLLELWPDDSLDCVCVEPMPMAHFDLYKAEIVDTFELLIDKAKSAVAWIEFNLLDELRSLGLYNRVSNAEGRRLVIRNLERAWSSYFDKEILLADLVREAPVFPSDRID